MLCSSFLIKFATLMKIKFRIKMKKIVLLVAIAILGTTATFAQKKANKEIKKNKTAVEVIKTAPAQIEGAKIVFESETIDYGTVAADSDGNRQFVFTNTGNKPLIITNTQGSCGCTVPTTPKDPIAPGAKGIIGVKYATDRAGQPFTKSITVTSNAVGQETKVLTIKGTVLPRATPTTPPAVATPPVATPVTTPTPTRM
jgi:hypothetical protein